MDPQIVLLGKIKRELAKAAAQCKTSDEKKFVLDFAQRCIEDLRGSTELAIPQGK